jgi:uncharacterized membrane protein (DUF106 family)
MVFETLNPTVAITLIAIVILVIIQAFYRFLIDQNKAKQVKDRIQQLSSEARKSRGDEAKSKELMKESMAEQNKLMRMNMKPMILSFVIVAILLPYMAALYSDVVVPLNESGSLISPVPESATKLLGEGFTLTKAGSDISVGGAKPFDCQLPCRQTIDGNVWKVLADGRNVKFELIAATLPTGLPLVGGWELGWIWWYILVSIPLSLIIRALYGIKA